ncbi:hypothetical protein BTN49_1402 [Candidatus Enterovibrio escicola]|uniref:Uncharacterized protein n=1 Tax=Candidatus Enterovibrio escicola TaxID=1927127 RepID=A0A2A5T3Y1_9GAMM|nr:hypothetical protein BTN49_1402 [Candidatus Enterovibrio escacola]
MKPSVHQDETLNMDNRLKNKLNIFLPLHQNAGAMIFLNRGSQVYQS